MPGPFQMALGYETTCGWQPPCQGCSSMPTPCPGAKRPRHCLHAVSPDLTRHFWMSLSSILLLPWGREDNMGYWVPESLQGLAISLMTTL